MTWAQEQAQAEAARTQAQAIDRLASAVEALVEHLTKPS